VCKIFLSSHEQYRKINQLISSPHAALVQHLKTFTQDGQDNMDKQMLEEMDIFVARILEKSMVSNKN
jgi:hypothetical protein